MDIMIDTNVVISAAIFPNERMNRFLECICAEHELFLCSYRLEEIDCVVRRKRPGRQRQMELFLQKLRYTLIHTPAVDILGPEVVIPDDKDYPILASAIFADVDILISGDHHFDHVGLDRPEIMNIAGFAQAYI